MTNQRLLMIGALAGVVAYLGHGVMDVLMVCAKPTIVVWELLGFGAALAAPLAQDKKEKVHSWVLSCLAMLLMIGLLALWKPAAIYMNLGAVQAHNLLSQFPTAQITAATELDTARTNLEEARRLDPTRAQAHLLLSRFARFQGDYAAANQHYEGRVAFDMQDPVATYNPALQLRLLITSEPPPEAAAELVKIFHNWNVRFSNRAEGYLLKSILASQYQSNLSAGTNLLKMGIEAGALPPGLLDYVLRLE